MGEQEIKTRLKEIEDQVKLLGEARKKLRQELAELCAAKDGRFTVGRRYTLKRGSLTRTVQVTSVASPPSFTDSFDVYVVTIKKDGTEGNNVRVAWYDLKNLTPVKEEN